MSQIRSLRPGTRNIRPHKSASDCEYQVVRTNEGTLLLQLSTFGSDERQDTGEVTQTLQFDLTRALELLEVLSDFTRRSE